MRVVFKRIKIHNFGRACPGDVSDQPDNQVSKLLHGILLRVAEVDGLGTIAVHERNEPIDQVNDKLERARRFAVTVYRQVLVFERLENEV